MTDKLIIKVPKIRNTVNCNTVNCNTGKMAETLIRFAFERLEIQEED